MEGQFLSVDSISAAYNKALVIDDISFNLNEGELACLLGPSGCGKTTILRAISGFQNIESGNISLDKNIIATKSINVLPEKRNVGMVFQEHALFPHLSIEKNIGFGLHKQSKEERKNNVAEMPSLPSSVPNSPLNSQLDGTIPDTILYDSSRSSGSIFLFTFSSEIIDQFAALANVPP